MKKVYTKPVIVIEDFSLNTSIAGDCEKITTTTGYGKCGLEFGGDTLFIDKNTGCSDDWSVDDGSFNGICYYTPTDDNNVFTSG